MFDIAEELKKLPQKPGVYLMKNEAGEIIYVGKAINLRESGTPVFPKQSEPYGKDTYHGAPY